MKKELCFLISLFSTTCSFAEPVKTIFNPFTSKLDYITKLDSTTLPSGTSHYIHNANALQSGATFFVSSGSVRGQISVTSIKFPDGTIQVTSPTTGGGIGSTQTVNVQIFTTTGTYTPWVNMSHALVYAVGGGGSSVDCDLTDEVSSGGGGGGTAIKFIQRSDIGVSTNVDIGAAPAIGQMGSPTNFGGLLTAYGGGIGVSTAAPTNLTSTGTANGGIATGGDINITGGHGGNGVYYNASLGQGGIGGSTIFGFGGWGSTSDSNGGNGTSYGSGGGGCHAPTGTDRNGGTGSSGLVYIIEYSSSSGGGGGGSGTPGGSSGDIQYNDGGSFGGFGNYDSATSSVTLDGTLQIQRAPGFFTHLSATSFGANNAVLERFSDSFGTQIGIWGMDSTGPGSPISMRRGMVIQGIASTGTSDSDEILRIETDQTKRVIARGQGLTLLTTGQLILYDADNSHYVGFISTADASVSNLYVLPQDDGSANQVLTTDGSNNLSWATPAGGSGTTIYNATSTAGFPYGFSASTGVFTSPNALYLSTSSTPGFITNIALSTPSANRIITVPNSSGTIVVSAASPLTVSTAGALSITSPLPIANGGTNSGSQVLNDVMFYNGSAITGTGDGSFTFVQTDNKFLVGAGGQIILGNGINDDEYIIFKDDYTITGQSQVMSSNNTLDWAIYLPTWHYNATYFNGTTQMRSGLKLEFMDAANSNYTAFKSSAAVNTDNTYVLPASSGSVNQAIYTDGNNNLQFKSAVTLGMAVATMNGFNLP